MLLSGVLNWDIKYTGAVRDEALVIRVYIESKEQQFGNDANLELREPWP
jgi:hypothetical protein